MMVLCGPPASAAFTKHSTTEKWDNERPIRPSWVKHNGYAATKTNVRIKLR